MREWLRRARYFLTHRRRDDELAEEIEFHRAMKARELEETGLSPANSAREARRALGNDLLARDRARDVWIAPWIQDIAQDLRFAARLFVRDRGFTAVAVIALGLGIGVNNTLFAIVNAYCLRGLPIDQPEGVVYIATLDKAGRGRRISYQEFQDLQTARTLSALAAFATAPVALRDEARPAERLQAVYISAPAFRIIGESPVLGRDFRPEDDRPGAAPVVILASGVWTARYGGDPDVIGRTVIVNGVPATVVGVMRERFGFPANTDLWQPLSQMRGIGSQPRDARSLGVIARLEAGADVRRARAEIEGIGARMARDHPATAEGIRYTTVLINEQYLPSITHPAWIAFGTTGLLVLLIACANVANLLLARSLSRAREVAIRASLGASRRRVVRQLLVESALLAACGGVLGFGLSLAGLRLMTWAVPAAAQPYWLEFSIDGFAFAFLATVCLGTVFVFGLVPAMQASKTDPNGVLKESGRSGTGGLRARRWTAAFLTAEIALTMILLSAVKEGFDRHMARLRADQVVDTSNLLTMFVSLPAETYPGPAARLAFYDALGARTAGIGSIAAATIATALPISFVPPRDVQVEELTVAAGETQPSARQVMIGDEYFATLRLPLVAGRAFTEFDGRAGQQSAIVNRRFAAVYFGGGSSLGRRIRFAAANAAAAPPSWLTIVGVSPDVRQGSDRLESDPVVYVPLRAEAPATAAVIVRATADAASVGAALREEVRAIDPDLAIYRILTLEQAVAEATWNPRLSQWMISIISLIAITLAMVGLFAVTSHGVAQRTQEIAVRIALGADRRDVGRFVLRRALVQLAGGIAAGVACTYAWRKLIFGEVNVGAADLAAIAALLVIVAVAACMAPTRRAMRVDPVVALRSGA